MLSGSRCRLCGDSERIVAGALGVCLDCIRGRPKEALPLVAEVHARSRREHGLPDRSPRTEGGARCELCSNRCSIGVGESGYCGLRANDGVLRSISTRERGLYYAYKDPHVTNCCSAWFCPAGTGAGFPDYAHRDGPEHGYSNLAVFMYGCNFDCLFCQNPSHKEFTATPLPVTEIADRVASDPNISCICYFGGSPEPQLPFILEASQRALDAREERPLRICFEWNGCGHPGLVRRAAELSLKTGGNIKFDLKCSTPGLSLALSGVDNGRAFENFETVAREFHTERPGLPVVTATTLLVPGYVDPAEVESIARFIAEINPSIPYGLLAFHPAYRMGDLSYTPLEQAAECYRASRRHLKRVNVGNLHILGLRSMEQFLLRTGMNG